MAIKKILLVGTLPPSPDVYTYTTSFYWALTSLGYQTTVFDYRQPARWWKYRVPYIHAHYVNQALLAHVKQTNPDHMLVLKGETIWASTLATIKKTHGCTISNFYTDNPFTVWNGNSNQEVLASLPHYDCFMSWSKLLQPILLSAGSNHSCYFPFAYDETLFAPLSAVTSEIKKRYDVCFIGTWEPERERWLSHIKQTMPHISLAVWGNRWHEHCQDIMLRSSIQGPALYGTGMIEAFRASHIVLNFIRAQNSTAHNMRSLEVPASGAFLLTQRSYEQAEVLFKEHEHIGCFETPIELVDKINYYLARPAMITAMAQKAHAHVQHLSLTQQLTQYFDCCPVLK